MKKSDVVLPKGMEGFYNNFHFSPAVKDKDRLFLAGMIGLEPDGTAVKDPEKQYTQAFETLKAVLAEAGCSYSDVVEMTTFHVGLQAQLQLFSKVKDRYMPEPYPAWTGIGVSELAVPGALVEIRLVARLRS
jgi:enamine deaminase RidA (YjgF/YER057c/UK114 family)